MKKFSLSISRVRCFDRFLLLAPFIWLTLEQPPVDNLTILNQLAAEIVISLLDQAQLAVTTPVAIRSVSARDSSTWWFENRLIEALNDRGVNDITIDARTDTSHRILIEYQLLLLRVKYRPIGRNDTVQRQAAISVAIRVLAWPSQTVYLQQNFTRQYADTVAFRWLSELENKNLSFTRCEPPEARSKWQTYFEPFLVMATTGTAVVLFYYLRSK